MHLYSLDDRTALAYIFGDCCILIPLCIGAKACDAVVSNRAPVTPNTQAIRAAACAKRLKRFSKLSVLVMSNPFGKTPGQTACRGLSVIGFVETLSFEMNGWWCK